MPLIKNCSSTTKSVAALLTKWDKGLCHHQNSLVWEPRRRGVHLAKVCSSSARHLSSNKGGVKKPGIFFPVKSVTLSMRNQEPHQWTNCLTRPNKRLNACLCHTENWRYLKPKWTKSWATWSKLTLLQAETDIKEHQDVSSNLNYSLIQWF